ncbi:hypothetical protein [Pseudomonas sp. GWSMS-1]|uniref:hypothetical protein n=1 Tax=Pseudomonas sp. GWSMS-1 TaxID=3308997 RepID=UPI003CF3D0C1
MAKPISLAVCFSLLLGSNLACAEHTTDDDGFKQPMQHLQFNPGLDQREFERSTCGFHAIRTLSPR